MADSLKRATSFVAMIPVAASVMDLLAANTPEQRVKAGLRVAEEVAKFGASKLVGSMTAQGAAIAPTFAPVSLGVFTVTGVSLAIGVAGIVVAEAAASVITEQFRLYGDTPSTQLP